MDTLTTSFRDDPPISGLPEIGNFSLLRSAKADLSGRARNPYAAAPGLWIPGSLATLAPRNDREQP